MTPEEADSPLERPETDGYCDDCGVATVTIGGQAWHTGHHRHNEYWSECRGGWRPPKDIKTYTEALVSEMIPADLVTVDHAVQGGEPCMKGTRVQAYLVATLLEDDATWEQVREIYPSIPAPETVREVPQPVADGPGTVQEGTGRGTEVPEAQDSAQVVDSVTGRTAAETISRTLVLPFGTLHNRQHIREVAEHIDGETRPVHYREAAADLRAYVAAQPPVAADDPHACGYRDGIIWAAEHLESTAAVEGAGR